MTAIHLNLLNAEERRTPVDAKSRIVFTIISGLLLLILLVWGGFLGVQLAVCSSSVSDIRAKMASKSRETAESNALRAKLNDLKAEDEQFSFYLNGRQPRGQLLKRIAAAIPEGVTLTTLSIPPPSPQMLRPPLGSKFPPMQGATQKVEQVELRLTGLATREQDVFQMMQAFEGESFTGLLFVVQHPAPGERESPRVLAFRQEAPQGNRRDVFFDIVYDLKPREFAK